MINTRIIASVEDYSGKYLKIIKFEICGTRLLMNISSRSGQERYLQGWLTIGADIDTLKKEMKSLIESSWMSKKRLLKNGEKIDQLVKQYETEIIEDLKNNKQESEDDQK